MSVSSSSRFRVEVLRPGCKVPDELAYSHVCSFSNAEPCQTPPPSRVAGWRLEDTAKGNRPSFAGTAPPEEAEPLYGRFCAELRALGSVVETGVFGAKMELELVNDGPVTVVLEV